MPKKENTTRFALSILSGVLLVVSGTRGSIGVYEIVLSTIVSFVEDALFFQYLTQLL